MDTKRSKAKSGQAMVEFCIGLIAMITVIAGIFQLGRMGLARTEARVEATGTASALSMNASSDSFRLIRSYVRQNNAGGDTRTYSVDDMKQNGNADAVYDQLLRPNRQQILQSYAPANTLASIQNSRDLMGETGLVSSTAYESDIPVMPIIRRLFFNQNTVDIDVTVWSVRTGDFY